MNEAMSENGMVIPIITVALHRPRKMNTTTITNINAYAMVSASVFTVILMLSDESMMTPISTSDGRRFCSSGSFSYIELMISTAEAEDGISEIEKNAIDNLKTTLSI